MEKVEGAWGKRGTIRRLWQKNLRFQFESSFINNFLSPLLHSYSSSLPSSSSSKSSGSMLAADDEEDAGGEASEPPDEDDEEGDGKAWPPLVAASSRRRAWYARFSTSYLRIRSYIGSE